MNGLHIFRRDFRIVDNLSLNKLVSKCSNIYLIFIFDPKQLNNKYAASRSIVFMIQSLLDLNKEVKIEYLKGIPDKEIEKYIKKRNINIVSFNRDYTPYSRERDTKILKVCKKHGIEVIIEDDPLLTSITYDYKVFSPFYKKVSKVKPATPLNKSKEIKKKNKSIKSKIPIKMPLLNSPNMVQGGRSAILSKMNKKEFKEVIKEYKKNREIPKIDTTLLSAYVKYGCISIRELYYYLKREKAPEVLIRQVYWQDFYTLVMWHYPHIANKSFLPKWDKSPSKLKAWKTGKTGYPIIDAGMRQLNETGWMHNRVRMLVASFLAKDLYLNWREGEKYFCQKLVDINWAVNTGNWSSVVGVGASALPWFRVMNPITQQKKYDPDCIYIKEWIPELREYSPDEIHDIDLNKKGYPKPIVNHDKERIKYLDRIKKIN